jgi:transcriptional regulator with XRE-family HTH domain
MNRYKLEYEMKIRGITIGRMCHDLNISRSAFYKKCRGKSEFSLSEIQAIVDYLGLESPMGIFFPEKCLKRHENGLIADWRDKDKNLLEKGM